MGRADRLRRWWARALPWVGGAAAMYCSYPVVFILPFILPVVLLPLLALFAVTIAAGVLAGRSTFLASVPGLGAITGAWAGAVAARVVVEIWVRGSHSSTSVLGFLAVARLVPFGMIYVGTIGWAVATFLQTSTGPRPRVTIVGFWVPLLVLAGLSGAAALEIHDQRVWSARAERAASPKTPPEELVALATDPDLQPRVARNPTTPEATLRKLSENASLRYSVATNPSAPPDLLEELSNYPDAHLGVAFNRRSPLSALRRVADDPSETVGLMLLSNPNTPDDVLLKLSGNPRFEEGANEILRTRGFLRPPPVVRPAPAAEPR